MNRKRSVLICCSAVLLSVGVLVGTSSAEEPAALSVSGVVKAGPSNVALQEAPEAAPVEAHGANAAPDGRALPVVSDELVMTNVGKLRRMVSTGHVLSSQRGSFTGVLCAWTEADNAAFRTELSGLLGGAPVDYFDARIGTPTVADMQNYAAVLTWVNYGYADNVLMGDNLADYVDSGGKAILGQWTFETVQNNWLEGRIMTPDYCPIIADGYATTTDSYAGDGITCIHIDVGDYASDYRDHISGVQGTGALDGTYLDGSPTHGYRADNAVFYSAGNTANVFGSGEWAKVVANMVQLCTTEPLYGACCDDFSGACTDNVTPQDCAGVGRWAHDTLCVDLDPLCGQLLGACCWGDEPPHFYECEGDLFQADCLALGESTGWYGGESCDDPTFECPGAPSYCDACYTNATDDWIAQVQFNEIDNITGIEGGGCSYGDYRDQTAFVSPGMVVPMTVGVGTSPPGQWTQCVSVWVDWNQDYVFDASERTDGECGQEPGVEVWYTSFDVTVPGSALGGPTTMRVVEKYNAWPPDACESSTYGEIEDYTVMVGDAVGACCTSVGCDDDIIEGDCDGTFLGHASVCDLNDCNTNGYPDSCDVATGASLDCNGNMIPDECEEDCNTNGIPDECDIADETSLDCNENMVPDECDIGTGASYDIDGNGIPDECQEDCNSNGILDLCDVDCSAGDCSLLPCGTSEDCQFGGVGDGIPDECQIGWVPPGARGGGAMLYAPTEQDNPDFRTAVSALTGGPVDYFDARLGVPDAGTLAGYDMVLTWVNYGYADSIGMGNALADYVDAGGRVILGQWTYYTGQNNWLEGRIMDPAEGYLPVTCSAQVASSYAGDGTSCIHEGVTAYEGEYHDSCQAAGEGIADGTFLDGSIAQAYIPSYDVFYSPGNTGLYYTTGDWALLTANMFVACGAAAGNDCNSNQIPDECDIYDCDGSAWCQDCQEDGVPDGCQIEENDCNTNLIPDDCEIADCDGSPWCLDCDLDGVLDGCQLVENDCNQDLIPDNCQLVDNDCNGNQIPDDCELPTDPDCNTNGILDECEDDCNENGYADECDIADCDGSFWCLDCQPDGIPDGCQLGAGGLREDGAMLYAPTEADSPDFRAAVSAMTGAAVDYFDARLGVPDAGTLAGYDVVMTWVNYGYADSVGMGNALADYVDTGGRVILGQWCYNTGQNNWLEGRIMDPAEGYLPVSCSAQVGGSSYAGDGTTCLHEGVTEYGGDYHDVCEAAGDGIADGTFTDGSIAQAYIPGFTVLYSPGNTGLFYTTGDWDIVTANFIVLCAITGADCNGNLIPDECDIADCDGSAWCLDCQENDIPDGCEDDCNTNGVPDDCDIDTGYSVDCDGNGIPDECDLADCDGAPWCSDCNENGLIDVCELGEDCNNNDIPDICDVTPAYGGTSEDCHGDDIPDECQLDEAPGFARDVPCTVPDAVITIDILTDDYPGETTWTLTERGVGVVASGGPYADGGTLYSTPVDVCSDSCYDFTIFDSYGDGICCGYGLGYYEVYVDGSLVGDGGEFGASESVLGMGSGCPTPGLPLIQLPNQSNGIFSDLDCAACGTGMQILAENVNMVDADGVGMVRFWGGYHPGDTSQDPDAFTLIIRDDAGGLPGAEIATFGPMPATTKELTGVSLFGVSEYVYTLEFSTTTIGPGPVHIEIFNDTVGNPDQWFWEAGNLDPTLGIAGQAFTFTLPEEPWSYDGATDMAYELHGPQGPPANDCNTDGIPDDCQVVCDLNGDEAVDGADYALFLSAFGTAFGDAGYEACADFDDDGVITLVDYQEWLMCFRGAAGGRLLGISPGSQESIGSTEDTDTLGSYEATRR